MHPALFSSVLAVLLVSTTAKAPPAPPSAPSSSVHLIEVAKISTATIYVVEGTVVAMTGKDGIAREGMLVKVKYDTPKQSKSGLIFSTMNVAIFSCAENTATLTDVFTEDEHDNIMEHVSGFVQVPWIKGDGTVTDAMMSQVCEAEIPSSIPKPVPVPSPKRIHIPNTGEGVITNI